MIPTCTGAVVSAKLLNTEVSKDVSQEMRRRVDERKGRHSRYEQKYKGTQRGWWVNTFAVSAVLKQERMGKANGDDAQRSSNSGVS